MFKDRLAKNGKEKSQKSFGHLLAGLLHIQCSMDEEEQARRKLNLHSDLPQTQIERVKEEEKKILEAQKT